jgi:hypothetical protein
MQQQPNRFTSHLFTGTNTLIILGLAAIVLTALLMYGSDSRSVQAAGMSATPS